MKTNSCWAENINLSIPLQIDDEVQNWNISLPLIKAEDGFSIYALDLMGKVKDTKMAVGALFEMLEKAEVSFDTILTAEAKAIELAHELAALYRHETFTVLRKSPKLYMKKPIIEVDVQSITTQRLQQFYLGNDIAQELKGKKVLVVEDVVSTGGTLEAIFTVAEKVGFEIAAVATVLTEGEPRESFKGVPLFNLGHISLPGYD